MQWLILFSLIALLGWGIVTFLAVRLAMVTPGVVAEKAPDRCCRPS